MPVADFPVASSAVAPIEAWTVPRHLDGAAGTNREWSAPRQIGANTDLEAVSAWLANFTATQTTFDAYRREAERLLLWCVLEQGKPLSSLTHEDWLLYRSFLADPQPRHGNGVTGAPLFGPFDRAAVAFQRPYANVTHYRVIVPELLAADGIVDIDLYDVLHNIQEHAGQPEVRRAELRS